MRKDDPLYMLQTSVKLIFPVRGSEATVRQRRIFEGSASELEYTGKRKGKGECGGLSFHSGLEDVVVGTDRSSLLSEWTL